MHFSFKIWQLVATILMILLRIKITGFPSGLMLVKSHKLSVQIWNLTESAINKMQLHLAVKT